jgi:hypothetical protein
MANTLTGLIPTIYTSLSALSREIVGFIPAATLDGQTAAAAIGQTVRSPVGNVGTPRNIQPGNVSPDAGDTTAEFVETTMQKARAIDIRWNGEEQRATGPFGIYNTVLSQQFLQAMRILVNEVEADLFTAVKNASSRAVGTAGTTPFGVAGDLMDFANAAQVLDTNGCPIGDRQFVASSAAMANLRGKQTILNRVNEAGSSDMLRSGFTDRVQGFAIRYGVMSTTHIKGTGTGYLVNNASGYGPGARNIAVDTGTGTILPGDVVTFAADPANKYVVGSGLSGGSFTLNKKGLLVSVPDNNPVTVGNNYLPSFGFNRGAVLLATRPPAVPEGGDSAADSTIVVDPFSGIPFDVRLYREYRQTRIEVALAWGVNVLNSEHIVTLLG